MQTIVFTGGGTTGHVTKNKILLEELKKVHPEVKRSYLGLKRGKEAELISADLAEFHSISSGKLRRYFSLETIPDFFRFLAGIVQSFILLGRIRPRVVFSSGGFVALPVVIGAWLRGIPVLTHETDSYPGLANRIIGKMATKIFLGFESARPYFESSPQTPAPFLLRSSSSEGRVLGEKNSPNSSRVIYTGNPVSPTLFQGSRERALKQLGFSSEKKVLLVMGGSQGAQQINELIWAILPELVKDRNGETLSSADNPDYRISPSKSSAPPSATAPLRTASLATSWQVIHLTGKGKKVAVIANEMKQSSDSEKTDVQRLPREARNDISPSYRSFEYVTTEYPDFLAAADLVISRAGGNSVAEIEALGKPAILIPLPLPAAAGDHQRKNAEEMLKKHTNWKMLLKPTPAELAQTVSNYVSFTPPPKGVDGVPQQRILREILPFLS